MDINTLSSIFTPVLFIKIITLIVIGFYAIFTVVVLTQVRVMTEILHLPFAGTVLQIISAINVILAISLFCGAFVIL